jgi:hypothetical protein
MMDGTQAPHYSGSFPGKIHRRHRERSAIVYIRQSTIQQVVARIDPQKAYAYFLRTLGQDHGRRAGAHATGPGLHYGNVA